MILVLIHNYQKINNLQQENSRKSMNQQTQKQWIIDDHGINNLRLVNDAPIPVPEGDDILIKIYAAGINPVDWKRCEWNFPVFQFPGLVGLDCFGLVVAKGPQVGNEIESGKTLVYCHGALIRKDHGTFAEYSLQDSRYVSIIRDSLIQKYNNDVATLAKDLAALICTGWTAYQAVQCKLRLIPGLVLNPVRKSFFVTAGAGGVGAVCLQLLNLYKNSLPEAQRQEIQIITTCSEKNGEYVKNLGATHFIDYTKQNIVEEIKKLTNNEGVDVWIDMVSAESVNQGLTVLGQYGELVVVVDNGEYSNEKLFIQSKTIHNISLVFNINMGNKIYQKGGVFLSQSHRHILELKRIGDEFQTLFEQGHIKPIKYSEITIEQVRDSLIQVRDGKQPNKLILVNK